MPEQQSAFTTHALSGIGFDPLHVHVPLVHGKAWQQEEPEPVDVSQEAPSGSQHSYLRG